MRISGFNQGTSAIFGIGFTTNQRSREIAAIFDGRPPVVGDNRPSPPGGSPGHLKTAM
jgi:hypothetical protein